VGSLVKMGGAAVTRRTHAWVPERHIHPSQEGDLLCERLAERKNPSAKGLLLCGLPCLYCCLEIIVEVSVYFVLLR
jgi:hypothetical protein